MPNLKDIKTRIAGVKKTRQITSAMKLVAGAKLRKATENAVSARPYQERLSEVLGRVAANAGDDAEDPLLERREEIKSVLLVVLTSDRGLCGPFNNNMLRKVLDWVDARRKDGQDVRIHVYGRKGNDFLRARRYDTVGKTLDYSKMAKMDLVRPLCAEMLTAFSSGEVDEVFVVYNEFKSVMTQTPVFAQTVPIAIPAADDGGVEHRYEPSAEGLLNQLLPLYLRTRVLQAFLETEAGEHAARMTAMDNATRNATDLIDRLTLDYNRARQAAITTEITEIVSGAEAL